MELLSLESAQRFLNNYSINQNPFIRMMKIGVGQRLKATEKTPEQLYREVMSPNGTTEAGFQHLERFLL